MRTPNKIIQDRFYILYNAEDFPVLYFDTLKEFSYYFNRNYKHLVNCFSNADYIHLLIDKKDYFLYRFSDKELLNV